MQLRNLSKNRGEKKKKRNKEEGNEVGKEVEGVGVKYQWKRFDQEEYP